jgi:hypothetical protein
MNRQLTELVATALVLSTLTTACRPKPTLDINVTVSQAKMKADDTAISDELTNVVVVSAEAKDPTSAQVLSVRMASKSPFKYVEDGSFNIAAADLPPGKSTINVTILGKKRGIFGKWGPVEFTKDIEVTRDPLGPKLTSGGLCASRKHGVCIDPVAVDKTGKATFELYTQPGTKLEIEGKATTLGNEAPATVSANFGPRLLPLPVGAVLKVPIKVTSPEGVTETYQAQVKTGDALNEALKAVATGPVLLFGESPKEGRGKGIFLATALVGRSINGGPLQDIECVAIAETSARSRSCGQYKNTKSGETKEAAVYAYDATVTAYQRKTGKKIATKKFAAEMPSCSTYISGGQAGAGRVASGSAPSPDLWLKSVCK